MYINSSHVHVAYNLQAVKNYWKSHYPCEWLIDSRESRWMQILSAWRWGKMIVVNFNNGQIVCDFTRSDRFYLETLAKRVQARQGLEKVAKLLVRKYQDHSFDTVVHEKDGSITKVTSTLHVNENSTLGERKAAVKAIADRLLLDATSKEASLQYRELF